jgi:hypothetical protein
MTAPSSTVLSTSNSNYQAMLTTELLNPANIVNSPSMGIVLQGPCVSKVLERLVLQVQIFATSVQDLHCADVRTHTRMERRDLARELATLIGPRRPL